MTGLLTEDLAYELPTELVAQKPLPRRDDSRLLVLHRREGSLEHRRFRDLPEYLHAGDALILNTTRVFKARLLGHRQSGGEVEFLLLERRRSHTWTALCRPAARLRDGEHVRLNGHVTARIERLHPGGRAELSIVGAADIDSALEQLGHVPLPPYIQRPDEAADAERYQTVYAETPGAVAAPTAGLHFTASLLQQIEARGVRRGDLVLHVGPGTFKPITTRAVADHTVDPERISIPAKVRTLVHETRAQGGRVAAVGTTCVRALETLVRLPECEGDFRGVTDLVISPPFEFRAVDVLITNFHLPCSSLLALVAAFAGLDTILEAYRIAVRERYRFYSYGDAMVIL